MSENQDHSGERIAKIMARAGLCSRREAESWIEAGRVAVNGKVLDSPAFNVKPDDRVTVDGAPLNKRERTRLFFFHKPRGTVTTAHDPQGRPTVFDALPEGLPRLVTVGRLDINTEGLLLLTNDGGLARALELPATGWLRRYRVRAHGRTDQAVLDKLRDGVTIDGVNYRSIEARLDREQGSNVWLTIGLREGKNREVKKVLEHIGLDVNRLIRVSFGPFQLGELEEGAVEEVKTRILKDQLGDKIATLAGADFDAPLQDEIPHRERDTVRRDGRFAREDGHGQRHARGTEDDARNGKFRRAGNDRDKPGEDQPAPVRERPLPGKRMHVSALREQRSEQARGSGRRRIEKAETADRSGRAIAVERVVKPERKPAREEVQRKSRRNAERFSKMSEERNARPSRGDETLRRPRRLEGERAERPWKSKFRTDRPGFDERPEGDRGAPWAGERRPSFRDKDKDRDKHRSPAARRQDGGDDRRPSSPDRDRSPAARREAGGERSGQRERKPWARNERSEARPPRSGNEFRRRSSGTDGEKREFRSRDDRPGEGGVSPGRGERKPWARDSRSGVRGDDSRGENRPHRGHPDDGKPAFRKRDHSGKPDAGKRFGKPESGRPTGPRKPGGKLSGKPGGKPDFRDRDMGSPRSGKPPSGKPHAGKPRPGGKGPGGGKGRIGESRGGPRGPRKGGRDR